MVLDEPGHEDLAWFLAENRVEVVVSLPAAQAELERSYKRELGQRHGIEFDRLLTLTNMPIRRYAEWLARRGELEAYQALLVNHFNPAAVPDLMCRTTVSVDWRGELFDCDFNQAADLPCGGKRRTIFAIESLDELRGEPIATGEHCFGCTAGAGSSCYGALAP